jgi:hypothetical protein
MGYIGVMRDQSINHSPPPTDQSTNQSIHPLFHRSIRPPSPHTDQSIDQSINQSIPISTSASTNPRSSDRPINIHPNNPHPTPSLLHAPLTQSGGPHAGAASAPSCCCCRCCCCCCCCCCCFCLFASLVGMVGFTPAAMVMAGWEEEEDGIYMRCLVLFDRSVDPGGGCCWGWAERLLVLNLLIRRDAK